MSLTKEQMDLFKKIRIETGSPANICSNALKEANWNYDLALQSIDKEIDLIVEKKSTQETPVKIYCGKNVDNKLYAMRVSVVSDFLIRSGDFMDLCSKYLDAIISKVPMDKVEKYRKKLIANSKENIRIDIFDTFIPTKNMFIYFAKGQFASVKDTAEDLLFGEYLVVIDYSDDSLQQNDLYKICTQIARENIVNPGIISHKLYK